MSKNRIVELTAVSAIALLVFAFFCSLSLTLPIHVDEGLWGAVGKIWVKYHRPPLVGSMENKNIFLYILYAWSYVFNLGVIPPRIIGSLCISLTGLCIWRIAGNAGLRSSGIAAMLAFCLSRAWATHDGMYPSYTETYTCLMTAASILILTEHRWKQNTFSAFIAGLSLGIGVGFRQTAISALPVLLIAAFDKKNTRAENMSRLSMVLLGTAAISAASFAMYASCGIPFEVLIKDGPWSFFGNAQNVELQLNTGLSLLTDTRMILCILCTVLFAALRGIETKTRVLICAWSAVELFTGASTLKFWSHNFFPFMAASSLPLAACVTIAIKSMRPFQERTVTFLSVIFMTLLMFPYITLTQWKSFDRGMSSEQIIAQWIDTHSAPTEKVFMMTISGPAVVYFMNREPVGRFTTTHFVSTERLGKEFKRVFTEEKPALIVFQNISPFPENPTRQKYTSTIYGDIDKNYTPVFTNGWHVVLRRNDTFAKQTANGETLQ